MKSFEQLARAAYEAHIKHMVEHRPHLAKHFPAWDVLDQVQRDAWVASSKQLVAEYAVVH